MKIVGDWVANEEEEIAEEVDSGLEIRQRRGGKMGNEAVMEKAEEVETGEERSVYLDSDQDNDFNDITAGLKVSQDQLAEEKNPNGKADVRTEELNTLENIPVEETSKILDNVATEKLSNCKNIPIEEEHRNLNYGIVKNGLNSRLSSEKNSGNGIIQHEDEIEESEQFRPGNGIIQNEDEMKESEQLRPGKAHNLQDIEFDVERVLEEQETHDLYCPNCNSCITKRVILRKRKRIVRESRHDLPPEKLQHVLEGSVAPAETTEVDHEDETVFRCLSCFSIFIPRDGGFNIFHFFGRREENTNLRSSQQGPVRSTNWISSIFGSGRAKKERIEQGLLLPHESTIIAGNQTGASSLNMQTPPTVTVSAAGELESIGVPVPIKSYTFSSGDPSLEAKQNAPSQNIAGVQVPMDSYIFSNGDPSLEAKQSAPTQSITVAVEIGENGAHITNDDAGLKLPEKTNVLPGEDPFLEVKQLSPTVSASEVKGDYAKKPGVMVEPTFPGGNFQTNQNVSGSVSPSAFVKPHGNDFIEPIGLVKPISQIETTQASQNVSGSVSPSAIVKPRGNDFIEPIGLVIPISQTETTQASQNIHDSVPHAAVQTLIDVDGQVVVEPQRNNDWDVLKSIVYGGLIESLTSLNVISSAAGADTSTLNTCALGLANLIGGLFVIVHHLFELRSTPEPEATNLRDRPADRYWELLGRRNHFWRHLVVSILSYIIFGLLPPVIYGFSFRKSDNKEYKLIAVAAASLFCIALLGTGKAHVKARKGYIKSLAYYLALGVSASGLSYVAGTLIGKLLVELRVFDQSASPSSSSPSSIEFVGIGSGVSTWASR